MEKLKVCRWWNPTRKECGEWNVKRRVGAGRGDGTGEMENLAWEVWVMSR